jgi:hypothetical protein
VSFCSRCAEVKQAGRVRARNRNQMRALSVYNGLNLALRRISVFVGGCSIEAAEAVAAYGINGGL